MDNGSLLRGITNKDMKEVVSKAFKLGWKIWGMSGTTHAQIYWPPTGEKVGIATTTSSRGAYKSTAKQIERICGKPVLPEANSGKIKQAGKVQGYVTTHPTFMNSHISRQVDRLTSDYIDKALEFRILTMTDPARKDMRRIIELVYELADLESVFTKLRQPIPDVGLDIRFSVEREKHYREVPQ